MAIELAGTALGRRIARELGVDVKRCQSVALSGVTDDMATMSLEVVTEDKKRTVDVALELSSALQDELSKMLGFSAT